MSRGTLDRGYVLKEQTSKRNVVEEGLEQSGGL